MTAAAGSGRPEDLAHAIASELLAHPSVVRLDGGPLGTLATHLPGHKVSGVRVTEVGAPVEVGVVLRLDGSLPAVTAQLRERVQALAGNVPVHVDVVDVEVNADSTETEPEAGNRVT
ncbi:hypothetical protein [Amycolatopsis cihanbeyliensis]|uniref:Uncharacterized protein n=1 Tax=Amycolatopsis cihanbeyliensis TaxID=1128664 RepID=A0A542DD70_AMYCI|nr:hypothetical protein [Amycolatopsis cihanbeyliensis]TQJ01017.1 hypothetical protein FB471_0679 [Amycolatopsis cihanbeyliensis]